MSMQSIAAAVLAALATTPAAAASVWINEIHYDNDGADTNEFVEIAGTAGSVLDGWSLVLYNGGNGRPYNTSALTGTLSDTTGTGFGFLTVALSGVQNGAPDGFALFDGTSVAQFLSYEGQFTAVDGIANGLVSSDIGVFEAGSTPAGQSLQLTGSGSSYGDFTWAMPAANTAGAINLGQTLIGQGPVPTVSPVPLPAALPLFASGLGLMGLVGRRMRRA